MNYHLSIYPSTRLISYLAAVQEVVALAAALAQVFCIINNNNFYFITFDHFIT